MTRSPPSRFVLTFSSCRPLGTGLVTRHLKFTAWEPRAPFVLPLHRFSPVSILAKKTHGKYDVCVFALFTFCLIYVCIRDFMCIYIYMYRSDFPWRWRPWWSRRSSTPKTEIISCRSLKVGEFLRRGERHEKMGEGGERAQ